MINYSTSYSFLVNGTEVALPIVKSLDINNITKAFKRTDTWFLILNTYDYQHDSVLPAFWPAQWYGVISTHVTEEDAILASSLNGDTWIKHIKNRESLDKEDLKNLLIKLGLKS